MSALTQALGNHGATFPFEDQGKSYPVKLIDQEVKTAWEKWLYMRSIAAAKAEHGDPGEDEIVIPDDDDETRKVKAQLRQAREARLAQALSQNNRDFIACKFAFEGELSAEALGTPMGMVKLASLLFGCPYEEMLRIVARRKEEVKALIDLVSKESLPQIPQAAEATVANAATSPKPSVQPSTNGQSGGEPSHEPENPDPNDRLPGKRSGKAKSAPLA